MARAAPHGNNQPPKIIIVKKIIDGGHAGHHGGAWKVAYADFVTAMMAFFLLLWLLGATTEKQRKGIADYFAPTLLDKKVTGLGGNGVLGGESILSNNKLGPKAASAPIASIGIPMSTSGGQKSGTGDKGSLRNPVAMQIDKQAFQAIKERLEQQIKAWNQSDNGWPTHPLSFAIRGPPIARSTPPAAPVRRPPAPGSSSFSIPSCWRRCARQPAPRSRASTGSRASG